MGARRAARRRGLLHAQRLPDHQHPGQPVVGDREAEARQLLVAPRQAIAARAVRHAGGGDGVGDDRGPGQAGQPARVGRRRGRLLQQLVHHRPEPVLLREVRAARSARPPVVAGRGGTVLPALAAAADRRAVAAAAATRGDRLADAADRRRSGRISRRDGAAVSAWHGPDQGLRGNRHPRVRAADRRDAGACLAVGQQARRAHRAAHVAWLPARRRRAGRPCRDRHHDLEGRGVLGLRLPRWPGLAVRRDGGGRGRDRLPG